MKIPTEFKIGGSIIAITFAVVMSIAGFTNPYTPEGHEGYVQRIPLFLGSGGFLDEVRGPRKYGFTWRAFVKNIDVRPTTYSEDFNILASDDLNIAFRCHVILKVKEHGIRDVVEKFGAENWYKRYVREPFRTYVRDAVQKFTAIQVKMNRDQITSQINERLNSLLGDTPFVVVSLVVGNVDYPDVISQAVEQKLARDQLLLQKDAEKKIASKDAEIRIEEAKGIAQAQKIINATLTENYLMHEAIMAQKDMAASPNHTVVYMPSGPGGIPIVKTLPQNRN